ncbi:hypothetical protein [Alkaliphilus peptidifermentans]|uniref:Uncharacterized protein n=1 Tax=Alkaliphilus peptidifermentans DSM 18978 TaxID=1120976 RepID=A0A1G5I1N7_9FIRM|nr:hypothetical protein [Alkaliphilus peptidifermentans]SCY69298.1 hypothetical protein SAMN03080606_02177 [Alkaliphilus peptidifermentans DSM 18978]
MNSELLLLILGTVIFFIAIFYCFYIFYLSLSTRLFNKYFIIKYDEEYDMDNIYHIKIKGVITPKVDYLDIPKGKISAEINTNTIIGIIKQDVAQLELICPNDRNKAIRLIKKSYINAVKPFLKESLQNNKETIQLIRLSEKHRTKVSKLACNTCKYKVQCKIAFTKCNYERENLDIILKKGIKVDALSIPTISPKR